MDLLSLNFCDRGVNEQNIHIHAKPLYKAPLSIQSIDLSNNEFFDDSTYKQIVPPLKKADNLEILILDKT
jgi:hypothetical protein